MKRATLTTAFVAAALGLAGTAEAQNNCTTPNLIVSTDVEANTTWTGCVVLQKPIFVRNATLTIAPGTVVRGQPRSGPVVSGEVVGSPGALIVTQTGRIIANGSPSSPIIMTTAATDNNGDGIADPDLTDPEFNQTWEPGDVFLDNTPATAPLAPIQKNGRASTDLWGGLVVLGNAPTNNANKVDVGYGKTLVEGLTVPGFPAADATYGGVRPHDNSGILRFVSVRHAGDEIGEGNELNGITLGGVGDGTIVENVEVYVNFDDGVEWFGGTVNSKNVAVFFAGDDALDVDEGFTGLTQFIFTIQPFFRENDGGVWGSRSGNKILEGDGENFRPDNSAKNDDVNVRISVVGVVDPGNPAVTGSAPTPWPLQQNQFYNWTAIGAVPPPSADFTPTFQPNDEVLGWQFRNGFAGFIHNSIVIGTGTAAGLVVSTSTSSSPTGWAAIDNVNAGLAGVVCSTLAEGAAPAAAATTALTNGNNLNLQRLGGTAAGANVVNSVSFPGLVKRDATFNPTGNAAGKLVASLKPSPLNPRPNAGLTGIAGCASPRGPGLDSSATYRGAFLRTAGTLWTTGWTTLSIGGLLAN
jgi:hypothetical protein